MFKILLTICQIGNANVCKVEHLPYFDDSVKTPMACMMQAQGEIAKYMAGKPLWRVDKWKCKFDDHEKADI